MGDADMSAFRRAGAGMAGPNRPAQRSNERPAAGLAAILAGADDAPVEQDGSAHRTAADRPAPGSVGEQDGPAVRKIGARIPEALFKTLRDGADRLGLFYDQVLVEAMERHGPRVVERLAVRPEAVRRRKGMRSDVTTFHLRAADAEAFDRLKEALPGVSTSRLVTDLLELYFAPPGETPVAG